MTPATIGDAVVLLASQVHEAAHAGEPLTKGKAESVLRAAGLSRADARRMLEAGGSGYWIETKGPASSRGGRPPRLLLPLPSREPAAPRQTGDGENPVDNRVRLLEVARTLGFRRCEFRPGQVIPDGERFWRRFITTAPYIDIEQALAALGMLLLAAGDKEPS
jgi:hypothetical protein